MTQDIPKDVRTTYKDFSIEIDWKRCGYTRDELSDFLAKEGIMSKKYFFPPLHEQRSHKPHHKGHPLPITERIARNVLSLPMFSHMTRKEADAVIVAIKRFYAAKGL